ncbi:MAG: ATP-binding protein [Gammaproteobacteria bacterium]|nr:ATP-binding protein [Gammaproteobacteria bacterium]
MDPRTNPYAPGAGAPPPELAGRDALIEGTAIALDRIRNGLAAKSMLMVGLRGVGKTVLLNRISEDARCRGITTILLEAPEGQSLPGLLASPLHAALIRLSRRAASSDAVRRAFKALAGLVSGIKLGDQDFNISLDLAPEPGLTDSGNLDADLTELFDSVGEAAREQGTAIALFIDELQYVKEVELAALIAALHRSVQRQLPVTLVGAGLPQLVARTASAKSYAERLFTFPEIGPLSLDSARLAIEAPANRLGVAFDADAMAMVLRETACYPYFLQEWGKHCWDFASASPVKRADVETASRQATAELDASFFRARFDRLAPSEKHYLRAMAERGAGPHRSGEVARTLGRSVRAVAPTRGKLIAKGMIYSPAHGDTAFTVPLFDAYLRRVVPFDISE